MNQMTTQPPAAYPTAVQKTPAERREQRNTQIEILAIFHYVYGGFALAILLFATAVIGGIFTIPDVSRDMGEAGYFPLALVAAGLALGYAVALLNLWAGRSLQTHRNRVLCLVVAGFNCFNFPFGSLLGIFTIIVLAQTEVKTMFDGAAPPPAPAAATA